MQYIVSITFDFFFLYSKLMLTVKKMRRCIKVRIIKKNKIP